MERRLGMVIPCIIPIHCFMKSGGEVRKVFGRHRKSFLEHNMHTNDIAEVSFTYCVTI